MRIPKLLLTIVWLPGCVSAGSAAQQPATQRSAQNLLLVTIDGLRWQEVSSGADAALVDAAPIDDDAKKAIAKKFLLPDARARREALMPFLWSTVATRGVLYGDRTAGSRVDVANGQDFSYPGYNELLSGRADPTIRSNAPVPNRNTTVLERLAKRKDFEGAVVAFGSWDTFSAIINEQRAGVPVNAGWEDVATRSDATAAEKVFDQLQRDVHRQWQNVRYDGFTTSALRLHLERSHPRVIYLALGEPDDWAHEGRYDRYLESIARCDRLIADLWHELERLPSYADRTALLLTVDHGRGRGNRSDDWTDHGEDVDGADEAWLALLTPGGRPTPPRADHSPLTLAQVAATAWTLLGLDPSELGDVAPPIALWP